jgi:hypothetical protein
MGKCTATRKMMAYYHRSYYSASLDGLLCVRRYDWLTEGKPLVLTVFILSTQTIIAIIIVVADINKGFLVLVKGLSQLL